MAVIVYSIAASLDGFIGTLEGGIDWLACAEGRAEDHAARNASVDIQIQSPQGIRAVYSPTHSVEVKRDGNSARVSGEFGSNTVNQQCALRGSNLNPVKSVALRHWPFRRG